MSTIIVFYLLISKNFFHRSISYLPPPRLLSLRSHPCALQTVGQVSLESAGGIRSWPFGMSGTCGRRSFRT
jgi:hypothetical protein